MAAARCPDDWRGFGTSCYQLLQVYETHWGCASQCSELGAALSCITSLEQSRFVEDHLLRDINDDVWIGLYQDSESCVTGAPAGNFSRWEASQPNDPDEDCVALWSTEAFFWRDASCGFRAHCLCAREASAGTLEANAGTIEANAGTLDYHAFVAEQQILFDELRATVLRWWLLIILVLVPVLALAPLVCLRRCCHRKVRSTNGTCAMTLSSPHSTRHPGASVVSGGAATTVAGGETATIQMLSHAEEASSRLQARVAGTAILVGSIIFWLSILPTTLPTVMGLSDAFFVVTGHAGSFLSAATPLGLVLFPLGLRPTDAKGIRRVIILCAFLLVAAALVMVGILASSSLGGKAFTDHRGETIAIVFTLIVSAATVLHTTRLGAPRAMLNRFWLVSRTIYLLISLHATYLTVRPHFLGRTIVFWGGGHHRAPALIRLLPALSYLACALVFTRAIRGKVVRWLGSRTAKGSKLQEASFVSSLIGTELRLSAAGAYVNAQRLFRGLPLTKITPDLLSTDNVLPLHGNRTRKGTEAQEGVISLRGDTVPAQLGQVTAFLSYSWSDDNSAQGHELAAWVRARPPLAPDEPAELIWVDRACISLSEPLMSLSCLPVFLAGCQRLLVLAGLSYPSRLWCAMELFGKLLSPDVCFCALDSLVCPSPSVDARAHCPDRFSLRRPQCF
jgi:hypothetical protein